MKRILLTALIVLAGTTLVVGFGALYSLWALNRAEASVPTAAEPPEKLRPLPDVDALAARLPFGRDVYDQLRDACLAAYGQQHPGQHPYDHEARETLKLASYLWVWGDFYGEGLWAIVESHCNHLYHDGCPDQLWRTLHEIHFFSDRYSNDDANIEQLNQCENDFARESYPAALRLWAYQTTIDNMISAKSDRKLDGVIGPSLRALPVMAGKAVACYAELIRQHVSHWCLYHAGWALLHVARDDENTLRQISTALDKAFDTEDRGNPQADVLDGEFYTDDAWNARGSGYANTVSDQGWQLFRDRLDRANRILNDVYSRSPEEPGVARTMMSVVLGQQQPRDQMELWFQRGLKANPEDFGLYLSKRWYLLPRWYGSDEKVWSFGLECSQSTDWAAKIPMVLAEAITDRSDNEPEVYAQPEIWQPLEKVYREFLSRYPNSVHYRSMFALAAAQGGHWDVAKEQFKVLADDWDPDVFTDTLYADTMRSVRAH